MLNKLIKEYRKLNTFTKYPSILTYHKLGKKGILTEELTEVDFTISEDEELEGTEKVDGTNIRTIICNNDYLIGLRDEIIYAKGDRILNDNKLGVLETCIPIAEKLVNSGRFLPNKLYVIYGENYGFNIGRNYKNYSKKQNIAYRVFDVWEMDLKEVFDLFEQYTVERLATWRDQMNQPYYTTDKLAKFVADNALERTPILFTIKKSELPTNIVEMHKFLSKHRNTIVGLDSSGKSEGIVVRDKSRRYIKKIRVEEYDKTLDMLLNNNEVK